MRDKRTTPWPRRNKSMVRVGKNWWGLDRRAHDASDRRRAMKLAAILLIIGMIILCCAGMMA